VYNGIFDLFNSRKLDIVSEKVTEEKLIHTLSNDGYIVLKAVTKDGVVAKNALPTTTYVILTPKLAKSYKKSAEIKSLLKKIDNSIYSEDRSYNIDIIVIADEIQSKKIVVPIATGKAWSKITQKAYSAILANPLTHTWSPREIEIIPDFDSTIDIGCELKDLCSIHNYDPLVFWVGAESGNVLRIVTYSEICVDRVEYYVVGN